MFIGHPNAGHGAAIIYTIFESCRRHKVEPLAYLDDVLRRLPGMTNHEVAEAKMTPQLGQSSTCQYVLKRTLTLSRMTTAESASSP